MKNKKLMSFLIVLTPLLIGACSAFLSSDAMKEYATLNKPFLAPPAIVFPIAWTILYLLMGIGAAIIYTQEKTQYRSIGLALHGAQLILNFFWSLIFFNMKAYMFAFICLIILWLIVFSMLQNYKQISSTAFFLNVPYIVWLTFAGYLNLAVAILN